MILEAVQVNGPKRDLAASLIVPLRDTTPVDDHAYGQILVDPSSGPM